MVRDKNGYDHLLMCPFGGWIIPLGLYPDGIFVICVKHPNEIDARSRFTIESKTAAY